MTDDETDWIVLSSGLFVGFILIHGLFAGSFYSVIVVLTLFGMLFVLYNILERVSEIETHLSDE